MTVFGKILVFLNLLFSVVTGALIVFVFTTRSNWVAAYTDAKGKAEAAEVAFRSEKASHDNDRKQAEQTQASFTEELKKADDRIRIAQEEAQRERDRALTQTNLNNGAAAAARGSRPSWTRTGPKREALVQEKESLRQRIIAIQKELDGWRTTAITSDLEAKNMRQRVTNLLRQVEELTARTRELEAAAPGGTGIARGGAPSADRSADDGCPAGRPRQGDGGGDDGLGASEHRQRLRAVGRERADRVPRVRVSGRPDDHGGRPEDGGRKVRPEEPLGQGAGERFGDHQLYRHAAVRRPARGGTGDGED